jgi:hypothetical protein
MAYGEFLEWMAFSQVEPLGGARDDYRFAMLSSLIANANRDPKKHPQPYDFEDFMPDWWQERQAQSLMMKFRAISEAVNARNAQEIAKGR